MLFIIILYAIVNGGYLMIDGASVCICMVLFRKWIYKLLRFVIVSHRLFKYCFSHHFKTSFTQKIIICFTNAPLRNTNPLWGFWGSV